MHEEGGVEMLADRGVEMLKEGEGGGGGEGGREGGRAGRG